MNRQQVTATLEYHRQELTEQFGVQPLALFGSTARNQATAASAADTCSRSYVMHDGPRGAESPSIHNQVLKIEDAWAARAWALGILQHL